MLRISYAIVICTAHAVVESEEKAVVVLFSNISNFITAADEIVNSVYRCSRGGLTVHCICFDLLDFAPEIVAGLHVSRFINSVAYCIRERHRRKRKRHENN